MQFQFNKNISSNADLLVQFCFQDQESPSDLQQQLQEKGLFNGKNGELYPSQQSDQFVLFCGLGKRDDLHESGLIKTLQTLSQYLVQRTIATLEIDLSGVELAGRTIHWVVQQLAQQLGESLYQYDTTKSQKATPRTLESVTMVHGEEGLQLAAQTGWAVAHGVNVARELGNLPGNVCTPSYLAEQAEQLAANNDDFVTEVLSEAEIEELGMGAFISVSKGSVEDGQLIMVHYKGGDDDQAPHVLVGKGITFDTGGISLKPGAGMEEMKYDMGGAAAVMGTMSALAELRPAINVIGVIAAAENMPAGNASKPGDVVTTLSGQTVEVINTDAEGRLVLCDALTYVERFKPAAVIDIATLTGACIVALGHHPSAVYSNNDALQQSLLDASQQSWDRLWPMPLWQEYKDEVKSDFADLRNIGSVDRAGGSVVAAAFLDYFTQSYPWAHLDVAGTAWKQAGKKGASGRPVPVLMQYLLNQDQA